MFDAEKASRSLLVSPKEDKYLYGDAIDDVKISRSSRVVVIVFLSIVIFIVWAHYAVIDNVTAGMGKVVPSQHEQVLKSLQGGVLKKMLVREGDIVEAGQVVAQLDPTTGQSSVEQTLAEYYAAVASVARLEAETNDEPLKFPKELDAVPKLKESEKRLYETSMHGLEKSIEGMRHTLSWVKKQLKLTRGLANTGAASSVDVMRLEQQKSELESKIFDKRSEFLIQAREDLAKAKSKAASLKPQVRGLRHSLDSLTIRAPVKGIVKGVAVSTKGGVVSPNGEVMTIIPIDDELLIQARIKPQDIAFIHPGQEAIVKITAYDYQKYGGLKGKVTIISPDTVQDKVQPDQYYYRVFIKTEEGALEGDHGKKLQITPGMVAKVDIKSGSQTVLSYIMNPIMRGMDAIAEN